MKIHKKFPYIWLIIIYSSIIFSARGVYSLNIAFSPVTVSTANILYHPDNALENQVTLAAALGIFDRPGFYGGYNFLSTDNQYWGSFFLPQQTGVFSIMFLHSANNISREFSHGLLRIGFGKSFNENLSFGFFINYSYLNLNNIKSSLGIEPSIIYSVNPYFRQASILGFHNVFIYSALRNLDYDFSKSIKAQPNLAIGLGTKLVKYNDFSTTLQTESFASIAMTAVPVSLSLAFQYYFFQLRAGYILNLPLRGSKNQPSDLMLGAGVAHEIGDIYLSLQYGVKGLLNGAPEHFFSTGVVFNFKDTKAPVLKVNPDYLYISPNGDGRQDYVAFHISVTGLSLITEWRLLIKNSHGEIVKTFEKDKRLRSSYLPFYRIITDLFEYRQYQNIPKKIIWDGCAENLNTIASTTINPPSIVLPDGMYFYEMTVTDAKGMVSEPSRGNITIDTISPDISLKRDTIAENANPNIYFSATPYTSSQSEDIFSGIISDEAGYVVKTYTWGGTKNLPKQILWQGLDDKNSRVTDGSYRFDFISIDQAGNRSAVSFPGIFVHKSAAYINIYSEADGFSPNNDGLFDTIKFAIAASPGKWKENFNWHVYVTNEKITDIKNIRFIRDWSGTKVNFPASLIWDGKEISGKIARDGKYVITLVVTSENEIFSADKLFSLDTQPPEISIVPDTPVITPDNDRINDHLFFLFSVYDRSAIKSYSLNVYEILEINGQPIRVPFKSWSSKNGIPRIIYFNGVSDKGLLMDSLHLYEIETVITDIYENTIKRKSAQIHSGILVNHSGTQLKITLTGLTYSKTNDPLNFDKLNELAGLIMNDYPEYKVRIEGHSNDAGGEEINLKVSEQRAKKIMRYFNLKGLPLDRVVYQGFGEILSLSEIQGDISRYKNNRIECILIK